MMKANEMYCLFVDNTPLFYTTDIGQIQGYLHILHDAKMGNKNRCERNYTVVSGFNEKDPTDKSKWQTVYKTCNRCHKILKVEYFINNSDKEVGSCAFCRKMRELRYNNNTGAYTPVDVINDVEKRFGEIDASSLTRKPAIDGSDTYYERSPLNIAKKRLTGVKPANDTIIIPKIPVDKVKEPAPLFYEPFKKDTVKETNVVKRWSFYYLYPFSQPKITSSAFPMSDYPTGVKKVGKDDEWVNFSLVCYSKNEADARERVEKFMKKHRGDLEKAEKGLDSKIPQWEFYK